jgi:hypothetical protein
VIPDRRRAVPGRALGQPSTQPRISQP